MTTLTLVAEHPPFIPPASGVVRAFDRLADLLEYPSANYRIGLEQGAVAVDGETPAAAESLAVFRRAMDSLSLEEQQELFVRAFDMNPSCALELGWHLFGEDYKRGEFLAFMRRELREAGVDERGELPDHIGSVLRLLGRRDEATAGELAREFGLPALLKLRKAFEDVSSPYFHLLAAIESVVVGMLGVAAEEATQEEPPPYSPPTSLEGGRELPTTTG